MTIFVYSTNSRTDCLIVKGSMAFEGEVFNSLPYRTILSPRDKLKRGYVHTLVSFIGTHLVYPKGLPLIMYDNERERYVKLAEEIF